MISNNVGTYSYVALNSRGIISTASAQVNRYLEINSYTAGKSHPYRVGNELCRLENTHTNTKYKQEEIN